MHRNTTDPGDFARMTCEWSERRSVLAAWDALPVARPVRPTADDIARAASRVAMLRATREHD